MLALSMTGLLRDETRGAIPEVVSTLFDLPSEGPKEESAHGLSGIETLIVNYLKDEVPEKGEHDPILHDGWVNGGLAMRCTEQPEAGVRLSRKERKAKKRYHTLCQRVQDGLKHDAETATGRSTIGEGIGGTGWSGTSFCRRDALEYITERWENRSILYHMVKDLHFRLVAYGGKGTWLVGRDGFAFGFRTDVASFMHCTDKKTGLPAILCAVRQLFLDYISKCGDRSDGDINANLRGEHWYMVVGIDRQNKTEPQMTLFHRQHLTETRELMENVQMKRLIKYAASVFEIRFPTLAQRVKNCAAKLRKMGYPEEKANPPYGYWYNLCINGPRKDVKGVMTRPHVDSKNLALMCCAVFVWGDFDHAEKAWLVLWEAGLIVQLPPGVWIFYPSSLITHFNVDMSDLQIVTTADGAGPTRQNSSPLHGVSGRGSLVLFNQATMFQYAELGSTVAQAKAEGKIVTCNNAAYVDSLPRPV